MIETRILISETANLLTENGALQALTMLNTEKER
jgi:hypothetical protein